MNLEFTKEDMKGVRVVYKGGYVEDYDPVVSVNVLNGVMVVDNTYHKHTLHLNNISLVEMYDRVLKVDCDFDDITWYNDENYETIWEAVK